MRKIHLKRVQQNRLLPFAERYNSPNMRRLPSTQTMQRAFARKDSQYDGVFFVGVKTTGVFCRPVCRAKPARPENLEFFSSVIDAQRNGYRPCKLCTPLVAAQAPEIVDRLVNAIREDPAQRITSNRLRQMRIDPSTARRQFQQHCGMTFAAFQRAMKMGTAIAQVRNGKRIIDAQQSTGFGSPSGFRDAFSRHFNVTPPQAGSVTTLQMKWLGSPLGQMLAVAGEKGIVLCDFFDRRSIQAAIEHVRERFGNRSLPAIITPGENPHLTQLEEELKDYFAGARRNFTVNLAPIGSNFEIKAWEFLRQIPYGETRTYGQQARAIGTPNACRAVGRANGMNFIAIVIPCHRVIGVNGKLTGYGGGVPRKQWLLEHERMQLLQWSTQPAKPSLV